MVDVDAVTAGTRSGRLQLAADEREHVILLLADAPSTGGHDHVRHAAVEVLRRLVGQAEAPAQRAEDLPPAEAVLVPGAAGGGVRRGDLGGLGEATDLQVVVAEAPHA